eukprot:3437561-Rhodomonas_salina.3
MRGQNRTPPSARSLRQYWTSRRLGVGRYRAVASAYSVTYGKLGLPLLLSGPSATYVSSGNRIADRILSVLDITSWSILEPRSATSVPDIA